MNATAPIRSNGQSWRLRRWAASICLLMVFAWTGLQAQKIERSRSKTVAGVVKRFTTDVGTGEIDGMVLDDGTIVHWKPHLRKKFTSIIAKGDRVEVTGWLTTINRSQTVLEADTVTNVRTKVTRVNEDVLVPLPPPVGGVVTNSPAIPVPPGRVLPPLVPVPPPVVLPPPPPKNPNAKTVTGTVRSFTKGPAGVVTGTILDKNIEVSWPARLSARFTDILAKGDRVEVKGRVNDTPGGKIVLQAGTILNLTTRQRRTAEEILPPPPDVLAKATEKTVVGTVKRFTLTPEANRNGMILESGTIIYWPSLFGEQVSRIASVGDKVKAVGLMTTGASGKELLLARSVTNLRTGKSVDLRGAQPSPIRTAKGEGGEEKPPDRELRTDRRMIKKVEDLEKRMKALEDKMDRLLKAVEKQRRQQQQQQ